MYLDLVGPRPAVHWAAFTPRHISRGANMPCPPIIAYHDPAEPTVPHTNCHSPEQPSVDLLPSSQPPQLFSTLHTTLCGIAVGCCGWLWVALLLICCGCGTIAWRCGTTPDSPPLTSASTGPKNRHSKPCDENVQLLHGATMSEVWLRSKNVSIALCWVQGDNGGW